mmetsp:Transcript_4691/g.9470  ORF Transcript_4691/g.9470 Transcript_4691/m.9470 type:complete len:81 (+) Transcript_4691:2725-2967(+)
MDKYFWSYSGQKKVDYVGYKFAVEDELFLRAMVSELINLNKNGAVKGVDQYEARPGEKIISEVRAVSDAPPRRTNNYVAR